MLRPTFPNALHERLRANEAVSGQVDDLGARVTGLDARVTEARTTADAAKAEAGEVKADAGEAKITAGEAKIEAGEAKITADDAKITAETAKSDAGEAKKAADDTKQELAGRIGNAPSGVTLASLQGRVDSHDSRIEKLEKRPPPHYDLDRFVGSMLLNSLLAEWRQIITQTAPDQRYQVFNESIKSNLCSNTEVFCARYVSQDWDAINKEISELKRKPKKDWSQQAVDPGILTTMGKLSDIAAKLWVPA